MKVTSSDALRGTIIAAASAGAAWALAALGFRNSYYLGVLLPAEALTCALVAWLLYLKEDGFARRGGAGREGGQAAGGPPPGALGAAEGPGPERVGAPADGRPDLGLFAPRDVLVERSPEPRAAMGRAAPPDPRAPRRALAWAAAELALLAATLYEFAGVGAHFFE